MTDVIKAEQVKKVHKKRQTQELSSCGVGSSGRKVVYQPYLCCEV